MSDLVLPALVRDIVAAVAAAGGRVLLVGGCVRDHLLGIGLKDWDLEVHGLELPKLEAALRTVGRLNPVGKAFSVYKVRRGDDEIDVSLPRTDSKVGAGHRGIQAVGDPFLGVVEASRRRDLTINAMMLDPATGELIDPWGGQADLAAGVLRAVDAETFLEDPLRAVRVVQFAGRFGFDAAPSLVALCRAAALDELPAERVVAEWEKLMLRGVRPGLGLAIAREAAITARCFPEVAPVDGPALDAQMDAAVAWRDRFDGEGRRMAWMMLVWLHGCAAPEAVLDRLKLLTWRGYPLRTALLAAHAAQADVPGDDAGLRWLATRSEVALVLALADVCGRPVGDAWERADRLGILHEAEPRLVLGRDLQAMGVRPGRAMGLMLDGLYRRQLDGELRTRDAALEAARAVVEPA
jgi:tRNA nucleotidyltransferase (CCA-adding enzyme)